ncbi:MAG: ferritin-like domain-containing protein [Deltaproteobacteria bacterium]|nr:ferritin-like domain-containing protein [Deltaproteobacteria bacterium]
MQRGRIGAPIEKPTSWWLAKLKQRKARMYEEHLDWSTPVVFDSPEEKEGCIRFFNAAFRAEESGLRQAHELADEVAQWDPELAETLRLYGDEEGWHRELLTEFMDKIGGEIRPMGKVTGTFYHVYGAAKHMETIMLTNLMFETIGATTYRMALGRVKQKTIKQMLTILTRDESFHVPLNVHFIRQILKRTGPLRRAKLQGVYHLVYTALIGSAFASRRVAKPFDHISFKDLATAYAANLGRLFLNEPDLLLRPSETLLRLFGLRGEVLAAERDDVTSVAAAEAAADRERVVVRAS